jgi:Tol biopolymer transport system component
MPASGGAAVRLSDRVAISGPIISNDGRHIVFLSQRQDGKVVAEFLSAETGKLELEIDVAPAFNGSGACWMPDNRHVAIADLRTGVANLWAISMLGSGPDRQLTHFSSGEIWSCAYSSNGKEIAIARGYSSSDVVLFSNVN